LFQLLILFCIRIHIQTEEKLREAVESGNIGEVKKCIAEGANVQDIHFGVRLSKYYASKLFV
jgi:hypothetical protein